MINESKCLLGSTVHFNAQIVGVFDTSVEIRKGQLSVRMVGRYYKTTWVGKPKEEPNDFQMLVGDGYITRITKLGVNARLDTDATPEELNQIQEAMEAAVKRELWFQFERPIIVGFMHYEQLGSSLRSQMHLVLIGKAPEGYEVMEMHQLEKDEDVHIPEKDLDLSPEAIKNS